MKAEIIVLKKKQDQLKVALKNAQSRTAELNTKVLNVNKKLQLENKHINYVMMLLVLEIFTGASMFYFDFPFGTQTAHLVFASIIFGLQFYILLQNFLTENKLKADDL